MKKSYFDQFQGRTNYLKDFLRNSSLTDFVGATYNIINQGVNGDNYGQKLFFQIKQKRVSRYLNVTAKDIYSITQNP